MKNCRNCGHQIRKWRGEYRHTISPTGRSNGATGHYLDIACRCQNPELVPAKRQTKTWKVFWEVTDVLGKRHRGHDILVIDATLDKQDVLDFLEDNTGNEDSVLEKFNHRRCIVDAGVKDWKIRSIREAEPKAKPRTKRVGDNKK